MRGPVKVASMAAISALVVALETRSLAEPGPIGRWLMSEPLALCDIGTIRAEEEAARAAKASGQDPGFSRWGGAGRMVSPW